MNLNPLNVPSINIASVYNIFDPTIATFPSNTPLDEKKNLEDVLTDENLTILDMYGGGGGKLFSLDDFLTLFFAGNKQYFGFSESNRGHAVFKLGNHTHTSFGGNTRAFSLYSVVLNGYCTRKGLFHTNLVPTKLMQLRKEVFLLQRLGQFRGHTFSTSMDEVEQLLSMQPPFQSLLHVKTKPEFLNCELYMHVLFRSITFSGYTHTIRFRFLVRMPVINVLRHQAYSLYDYMDMSGVDMSGVDVFCYRCMESSCFCIDHGLDADGIDIGMVDGNGLCRICDATVSNVLQLESITQIGQYVDKYLKGEITVGDVSAEKVSQLSSQILKLEGMCPNIDCISVLLRLYAKLVLLIQQCVVKDVEVMDLNLKLAALENDSNILHNPILLQSYIDEMNKLT